ncbi:TonB-dependent receptor [Methylobacillus sp. Pita2]|uniref:TonB-dependent receptor n=1 Tax=Methylobacillus sp. Pita2 TaxID=3383245 RepID=UPI0038B4A0FE
MPVNSRLSPFAISLMLALASIHSHAEEEKHEDSPLEEINVTASADASAEGLVKSYAGRQVAKGARIGLLGNKEIMDTPFSFNAYTNELIQDQQAKSVGDVLLNDPSVRVARGYGNFQESYYIRGFILGSDSVAYNGLYGLLPRQYISAELFERVEVLRGASAFLTGTNPNGDGIGGAISLLPKRAPNEPINRVTLGWSRGDQGLVSADFARRFGPDERMGIRLNVTQRRGGTGIDDEHVELGLASIGLDWRGDQTRISADLGYQDNKLRETRTNVTLADNITTVPRAPKSSKNWAQPWSYSNERDLFGTLRAEHDLSDNLTAWFAGGFRESDEANSLANLEVSNGATGASSIYRFDNTREDSVRTGEIGLRGKFSTGPVEHEWVLSSSYYKLEKKNAYVMDYLNVLATNLYDNVKYARPGYSVDALYGNTLSNPRLNGTTLLRSIAIGDTLSFLDKRVLLTLGLRHQKVDIKNYTYNTLLIDSESDQSRTSPVVGVVYKPTKAVSLYANYIEGLNTGESAPFQASNSGTILPPYVARQQEIGVKVDLGKLGFSTAYFTTDKPRGVVEGDDVFRTKGEDRHQGIELMAFGEAMPGLRVLGGVTFLDTEQRDTNVAATEGQRTIGIPNKQANLGAEWTVPGISGLSLDARVIATGNVYADAANTLSVPGWTRLDIGARYLIDLGDNLLTLRGRIDNVTDRDYWASSGGYPGLGYLVLGAPRTLTISATLDF